MSYDPYAYGAEEARPDDTDARLSGNAERIKSQVRVPAIALIVSGILNLMFALYMMVNSVVTTVMPADKLKEQQTAIFDALPPAFRENADQKTAADMKTQAMLINWPLTVMALLASVLPIAGGIRMLSLKSYALSMCGAICAAVPCMSIVACCGLGEIAGIWAIIVLLNPDVKSAFH